mmetsp:Transcript_6569/g.12124  ORF Transcript_6569/g.12124 Transcript_6569/m.12124 type:complete len:538 (-) Transcript_6569:131-1744(-)
MAGVIDSSRYGNAAPTSVAALEAVGPSDIAAIVQDVKGAFDREKTASAAWRKGQLRAFKKMLVECESELCEAMMKDLHKSPFEGYATELGLIHSEIDTALANLDNWMRPEKKSNSALNIPCWATTQRDPLGVVLILGAWNYPIQLQLAPLVGAIAGGNCAIMKPGSYATASSNAIARVVKKYMDQECIRVVEGNREITNALLAEKFELVFFTGSAFVGKNVARACAEHLTPCVLELGGKSPCIVDRTANIKHTAKRIVWAKFLNAGQTCVANDYLCVHESIADKLVAEIKKAIQAFYGKEPRQSEWFGRIINDGAYKRLTTLIEGEKERACCFGEPDSEERFVAPTLIDFKDDFEAFKSSAVMQDELFGPILPIYRYSKLEQVIQFVRHLPTGKPLALYAYGSDADFIQQIKTRTTSGGLCINDSVMHLANHDLPFGGIGNSGMGGGYHGKYSFDRFTHEKAVLEKSQMLDQSILFRPLLDARFPPYTPLKQFLVKTFSAHWVETLVNLPVPLFRAALKFLVALLCLRVLGYKVAKA